ncbi:MAG: acetyl ornithine aminotransferase family protein [Anaerolineales bacterium]|nr:acetyl ornithine aminotransferase family protein [Anaerolineales bacterium]
MSKLNVPGPKAQIIIEKDHKYISPSYPRAYPFVMDHGKGVEVWDVDGNRYVDFAAGIAVVATGHSHPKVVRAIQEQAEKFIHISSDLYHENWTTLAEKLSDIAPFEEQAISFMTNSGAESVEGAIKLARYHTGKSQIIAFLGAFHGRTYGAMSLTASKTKYHRGFYPMLNGIVHVPFPDPYRPIFTMRDGETYGERIVRYLEEEILTKLLPPEDTAAIIVEPIQGEGGYVVPAEGFFPALKDLCEKYGILLIVDEVQSGMGRTGKWWAIENFGVEPDIVCAAKGIASGIPLGAVIAKKSVMTWKVGAHGNTYGGNPIACAASLATIELIEESYLSNAKEMGSYLKGKLDYLKTKYNAIGDVRGIGLMLGVEFVKNRDTKEPDGELRDKIEHECFRNGLIILGCGKNTIRFAPPLCITRAEIDEGITIFEGVLDEVINGS